MKAFLWVVGSILLLDVLLVAVFAICAAVVRRRSRAHEAPLPEDVPGERRRFTVVTDQEEEEDDEPIPIGRRRTDAGTWAPHGSRGHRALGAALVAAMIFAGTAVGSPDVRSFVATAIGAVSGTLGSAAATPAGQAAGAGVDGALPEATESPTATTDRTRTGDRPSAGSTTQGPAVDPRPSGVPHDGVFSPDAPTMVTAVPAGSGAIVVSWADVPGETSYRLERSSDGQGGWATVATRDHDVTAVTDTLLAAGTTYFYEVVAVNGDLESPPSNVVSATTDVDAPGATVLRVVGVGSDHVDLAWDDVAGATGYRIERSADGEAGWTPVGTTGMNVTAATDASLDPATTYSYRIFATNDAGDSPASDVVTATTDQADAEATAGDPEVTRNPTEEVSAGIGSGHIQNETHE